MLGRQVVHCSFPVAVGAGNSPLPWANRLCFFGAERFHSAKELRFFNQFIFVVIIPFVALSHFAIFLQRHHEIERLVRRNASFGG